MRKLILLLAAISMVGCADPAFQQYIADRQAAIAHMPNGQQKFYEQARLDEQVLAEKQRQRAQADQAGHGDCYRSTTGWQSNPAKRNRTTTDYLQPTDHSATNTESAADNPGPDALRSDTALTEQQQ